jgi:DDE family transposase
LRVREDNARHDLLELLVIALGGFVWSRRLLGMALFGRAKEGFFREFLSLRHGIPSHDTFSRVFRLLDPVKFHACFLVFMRKFSETMCCCAGHHDGQILL